MSNQNRPVAVLAIALALALSFFLGLRFTAPAAAEQAEYEDLKVFTEVLSVIKQNYVEDVKSRDLIYGALRGMLRDLDPHSGFMSPEDFKELKVDTKGEFGGLGIQISIKDSVLTVISPIEDTPAWAAGIQAGDQILKIDGEPTKDLTLNEAVGKMRGKEGTKITITVLREGFKEPRDFSMTRAIIKVKSVSYKVLDGDVGYLKLKQFQERSAEDMRKALAELDKKGIKSLVLDLRNNPGGLLGSAVDVSSLFLTRGALVVYTQDRGGQKVEYKATGETWSTTIPVVVLVNQGSASASEIVAGALKDWQRSVVLGVTSFGKGSVQSVIPLNDGSGLRITTAKYYTPKGISIQNTGITPDITVKIEPKNGQRAHPVMREKDLEGHLGNEQLKDKPEGAPAAPKEESVVPLGALEEKDDTQLNRAVELLKTWVIFKTLPAAAAAAPASGQTQSSN